MGESHSLVVVHYIYCIKFVVNTIFYVFETVILNCNNISQISTGKLLVPNYFPDKTELIIKSMCTILIFVMKLG